MDPTGRAYTIHRAPRRRLSVRATTARLAGLAVLVSVVIWGGLALQMAVGRDPALGPINGQADRGQPRPSTGLGTGAATSPPSSIAPTTVAPTTPAPVQTTTS